MKNKGCVGKWLTNERVEVSHDVQSEWSLPVSKGRVGGMGSDYPQLLILLDDGTRLWVPEEEVVRIGDSYEY